MILLRASDRLAAPWKNGLGVTNEVAVHPNRAALDDFAWRVSLATVRAAGAFSHFPDIDRTLAVIEGRLSLMIEGAPHALGPESPPIAFPGDVSVEARIGSDPVIDLNLMTRRGRARGVIERMALTAPIEIEASPTTLVLAPTAGLRVISRRRTHELNPFDAIVFGHERASPVRLQPAGPTTLYVVRITHADEAPRR